jgi:RNA polymerase sigma-70 factor (ECF subfamily)
VTEHDRRRRAAQSPRLVAIGTAGSTETAEELMAQVARGERAAFEAIYDLFAPTVFGLVRQVVKDRAVSEEVSQEVFVELWRSAPRFDPARAKARSWICTIAHRRAVDAVRTEQGQRNRTERISAQPAPADALDASTVVVIDLDRERVRGALADLTDGQRQSIELAYYGGLSQTQIAETLDLPLGTVKTRVRDGLIRLRDALAVSDDE